MLIADKGYDADRIRDDMEAKGGVAVIPMHSGRKVQAAIDQHIYGLRNRVERYFNKLKTPAASPPDMIKSQRAARASCTSRHSAYGSITLSTGPKPL